MVKRYIIVGLEEKITKIGRRLHKNLEKVFARLRNKTVDESNFDVNSFPFVKEAYESKNGHLLVIM